MEFEAESSEPAFLQPVANHLKSRELVCDEQNGFAFRQRLSN
jgi:hypothetical protein